MTSELKRRVTLLEIAAALGGLAVVAGGVYQYLNSRAADLHAELTCGMFVVPPGLSEEFGTLHRLSDEADLQKNLDIERDLRFLSHDPESIKIAKAAIVGEVSRYLSHSIPWTLPTPYSLLGGIWTGSIENTGDRTARDVTITLPFTKYFCQKRKGEEGKCQATSEVARVGDLQPQEAVTVRAWTSLEPTALWMPDVRLSFVDGKGSVRILAPASPFWRWMERNWVLVICIALVMVGLSGLPIGLLVDLRLARQASRQVPPEAMRRKRRRNPPASRDSV